jgi:hypothetical protein
MRKVIASRCVHESSRSAAYLRSSVIVVVGAVTLLTVSCDGQSPTSPSGPPASGTSSAEITGATPSPQGDTSATGTNNAKVATAAAVNMPTNFRLERRSGSELRFNWDWGSNAARYDLSYAGRTIVLNQTFPGTTVNASDIDLSPGHTYTFSLRAIDQGGNASAPAQLAFETTPPDAATNLQQVSTTRITNPDGSGVDYPDIISFDPAHDAAGAIRSYEAFVDGRSLGSIGLPAGQFSIFRTWADTYTSQPCGPTAVQLRAYDSSLNESALSAPLSVLFPEYENCPPPHRDR